MRISFYIVFFLCIAAKGFSQFELPKKSMTIAPIKNSSGQLSPISSSAMKYPSIFDKKDKLLQNFSLLDKKPEAEKSIMDKEQFASPSKDYTASMNKKVSEGDLVDFYKKDYLLATYKCSTATARFAVRDYGEPDGDNIRIWLNDVLIIPSIYLDSAYKELKLNLREGQNILIIEAINEGFVSPNTAQFTIFNDKGDVIGNNVSGLLTRVKATILIDKVSVLGE